MSSDILISPSIIAADLSNMASIVKKMDSSVVDLLHMDIMDGNFVPNITFGPGYIGYLKSHTDIPLDIHLMIERPENSLESYLELNPWAVTIHYESTRFPARLLKIIRDKGIKSGLTINPATPVESIYDLLSYCDMVLIMSVDPGFYGQSFMPEAVTRIEKLSKEIKRQGLDTLIQVDGGVGLDNINKLAQVGASVFVAGSAVFKHEDINDAVTKLKQAAFG